MGTDKTFFLSHYLPKEGRSISTLIGEDLQEYLKLPGAHKDDNAEKSAALIREVKVPYAVLEQIAEPLGKKMDS
jgi:hypothetical protein